MPIKDNNFFGFGKVTPGAKDGLKDGILIPFENYHLKGISS
jgi:hypothetical protein